MKIEYFIKKHYKEVKKVVEYKAFRMHLNECDLHSIVNEKLTMAISRDTFDADHDAQFFGYLNLLVHNAAVDMKRKEMSFVDIAEVKESYCLTVISQPDIDIKTLAKPAVRTLITNLRNKKHQAVLEAYLIEGMKYEEVAISCDVPIGSVKTIIFQSRLRAHKLFGKRYNALMA